MSESEKQKHFNQNFHVNSTTLNPLVKNFSFSFTKSLAALIYAIRILLKFIYINAQYSVMLLLCILYI